MTDNYEWMKANEAQSVNDYSPYSDKQYNSYINDIRLRTNCEKKTN